MGSSSQVQVNARSALPHAQPVRAKPPAQPALMAITCPTTPAKPAPPTACPVQTLTHAHPASWATTHPQVYASSASITAHHAPAPHSAKPVWLVFS